MCLVVRTVPLPAPRGQPLVWLHQENIIWMGCVGWVGAGAHPTGQRVREMGLVRLEKMGQGAQCCVPPHSGCYIGEGAMLFFRTAQ